MTLQDIQEYLLRYKQTVQQAQDKKNKVIQMVEVKPDVYERKK